MKPIYSILILFLASCDEHIKPIQKISFEDSLINTLIGKWEGSSGTLPAWEIRKDSIYFFEHSKSYAYKIVNKDMIIDFPDYKVKFENIQVIKDTLLFIKRPGWTVQAIRFK